MSFARFDSVLLAAGLMLVPCAARAHHGWVDFDEKAEVTIQGTVTAFYFFNPHCVVEFEVREDKGGVQKWQGEFASKGELSRKGWTAASIEAGEKLTLVGHPSKDGTRAIHVIKILTSKGELKLGGEPENR